MGIYMVNRFILRLPIIGALTVTILAIMSCQGSMDFLSAHEKDELYTVKFTIVESVIRDGSVLNPIDPIVLTTETLAGAPVPIMVKVTLSDINQKSVNLGSFIDDSISSTGQLGDEKTLGARVLGTVSGTLPVIPIPSGLADGMYTISCKLIDQRGFGLHERSFKVFYCSSPLPTVQVGVYPPTFRKGEAGVLTAGFANIKEAKPYIRWTQGGSVLAEGLASDGFDRIIWNAPLQEGAPTIELDVFPFPPAAGEAFDFMAPVRKTVKILVVDRKLSPMDRMNSGEGFVSLLRLEGNARDSIGKLKKTSFLGKPYLDVYAAGFGYRLGAQIKESGDAWKYHGTGIVIVDDSLPRRFGRLSPFSYVVKFQPDAVASGSIISHRFSGGQVMSLSLEAGVPVVIFSGNGVVSRFEGSSALQDKPLLLTVSLVPQGAKLTVYFYVNGQLDSLASSAFDSSVEAWSFEGSSIVGGPQGCPALYDEVGIFSSRQSEGGEVFPAFEAAAIAEFQDDLIFAFGFESILSPPSMTGASPRGDGLGLPIPVGSTVRLGESLKVETPLRVRASGKALEFELAGSPNGASPVSISFSDSGSYIVKYEGNTMASGFLSPGEVDFGLAPGATGIALVIGKSRVPGLFPAGSELILSIRSSGKVEARLFSLLARYVRDGISSRMPESADAAAYKTYR